eukprot:364639-Chlamydomonas_euryale.AAC.24
MSKLSFSAFGPPYLVVMATYTQFVMDIDVQVAVPLRCLLEIQDHDKKWLRAYKLSAIARLQYNLKGISSRTCVHYQAYALGTLWMPNLATQVTEPSGEACAAHLISSLITDKLECGDSGSIGSGIHNMAEGAAGSSSTCVDEWALLLQQCCPRGVRPIHILSRYTSKRAQESGEQIPVEVDHHSAHQDFVHVSIAGVLNCASSMFESYAATPIVLFCVPRDPGNTQASARLKQAALLCHGAERDALVAAAVDHLGTVPASCNLEYLVGQLAYLRAYDAIVQSRNCGWVRKGCLRGKRPSGEAAHRSSKQVEVGGPALWAQSRWCNKCH